MLLKMIHRNLISLIAFSILVAIPRPVPAADAVSAQSTHDLIKEVMYNELQDRQKETYWQYHIEKRVGKDNFSAIQVETKDGPISRITARNGQPLSADEKRQEDERLAQLMRDPGEQARIKQHHDEDEQRLERLMKLMPDAFLFDYDGMDGDLQRLKFRPNPSFDPPTYEARIYHALAGEIWINPQQKRLAHLQGSTLDRVDFGYGLLGHVAKGGTFELKRQQVSSTHWKTSLMNVHVAGRIILFKTISKEQYEVRSDFTPIPEQTSLQQARQILDQVQNAG
jgi:hypothetical protein